MPSSFFHALAKASSATLSPSLALLQQAQLDKFQVIDTFVSQSASFARLIEVSQFFADFPGTSAQDPAKIARLSKKIENLPLPKTVTQELHQLYHHSLNAGFVRVACWTPYGSTPWISEIKGDVNLSDSLLKAWSAAVELNAHHGVSLVEAVTNCQAVIQRQISNPIACGEFFTRHPDSGEKQLLVIRLWPGAPHPALNNEAPTQYAIDVRTGLIVQRQIGVSRARAKRESDRLVFDRQPETAEFNDEKEILNLAHQLHSFKRQFPQQLQASFEIEDETLFITSIEHQAELRSPVPQTGHLLTKMYLATGSPDALDLTAHDHCDGIGLLRAEYVLARLETHPLSLLKRDQTNLLTDRLKQMLSEADHSYPDRRIVYRLQNFTTQELSALKSGGTQEKIEPNPYLGWRGGLRLMEQPELFEPELETFAGWLKHRHAPTGLIVPFVRSPAEWRWISNRWKERGFFDQPEFEHWFQVTTPENITNLESYILPEVAGLSINLRTITALTTGVDPDDPQLQASYPPPIELQLSILEQVSQRVEQIRSQSTQTKLKLHLHLEDFNHALVSSAIKLRYDGIVLHPAALAIGRSCVGGAEQEILRQTSVGY